MRCRQGQPGAAALSRCWHTTGSTRTARARWCHACAWQLHRHTSGNEVMHMRRVSLPASEANSAFCSQRVVPAAGAAHRRCSRRRRWKTVVAGMSASDPCRTVLMLRFVHAIPAGASFARAESESVAPPSPPPHPHPSPPLVLRKRLPLHSPCVSLAASTVRLNHSS